MGFLVPFDTSYFTGGAVVGTSGRTRYDVTVAGRGYLVDGAGQDPFRFESIPLLKRYFLQDAALLGETQLNPDDYWRRSFESWHSGAGQIHADNAQVSIRSRFNTSKGIDPWTPTQISLLNQTTRYLTRTTSLEMTVAGNYVYILEPGSLEWTTNPTGVVAVTGVFADSTTSDFSSATSITSDGYQVYVADPHRVNYTVRGSNTYGSYHTVDSPASLVVSAKGRLFTALTNVLSTHSGAPGSAVAAAYFTHPNSDWVWTDITGGPDAVYFAGFSGDQSAIYRAAIKSDGTNMDVPISSATLPTGEIARSLFSYLGFLFIGTDKGVRFASLASDGSISLGDLIPAPPVHCFCAADRFVWFGWSNFDGTGTGLGRMDLRTFNDTTPAYATDIMAITQGTVTACVSFAGLRVFAVAGQGVYNEILGQKLNTGYLTTGQLAYALSAPKNAIKAETQYAAGVGSYEVALSCDGALPVQMGASVSTGTAGGGQVLPVGVTQIASQFEVTVTLHPNEQDHSDSTHLSRVTLLVDPIPERRFTMSLPLVFRSQITLRNGQRATTYPPFDRSVIVDLWRSRQVVPVQDGDVTYAAALDDFKWMPDTHLDTQIDRWDGIMLTTWKAAI